MCTSMAGSVEWQIQAACAMPAMAFATAAVGRAEFARVGSNPVHVRDGTTRMDRLIAVPAY